jgi:diketogulonate reductase-like aldo/keto reductase
VLNLFYTIEHEAMKNFRLKSGSCIPKLGIGTYSFGGEHVADRSKDKEWIFAIKTAIQLGYSHIDTAEIYGRNHTEELVGKAIKGIERSKLFITSKVYKSHFRYDDVIAAAKGSIKRMNSGYLDLYLLHSTNPEIPIKETMEAMNSLVAQKLVRHIGVCNFTIEELKEAQKWSMEKIAANQMKFSLWTKNPLGIKTIKFCQAHDITVIAYKIFGRGKLLTQPVALLSEVAKEYGRTEAQIMVNWVSSKRNVVAIFSSMNPKHLKENMDSLNFKMRPADYKKIDSIFNY